MQPVSQIIKFSKRGLSERRARFVIPAYPNIINRARVIATFVEVFCPKALMTRCNPDAGTSRVPFASISLPVRNKTQMLVDSYY